MPDEQLAFMADVEGDGPAVVAHRRLRGDQIKNSGLLFLRSSSLAWLRQSRNSWRGMRRVFDNPHRAIGALDGVVVLVRQTISHHVSRSHLAILLILRGGGSNDERYPMRHVARRC
jgi:hypothetical protein